MRGMGIPITVRLKEIKKRRALRGKQRVELLINSVGKRTVVLLNPSFFTSLIPSSLCETRIASIEHCANPKILKNHILVLRLKIKFIINLAHIKKKDSEIRCFYLEVTYKYNS